jgi:hypothetical protein
VFSRSVLRALSVLGAVFAVGGAHVVFALDSIEYCNAVQNKVGLIRYPLGTIGVSSTDAGEIADVMTLVPRAYACPNSVTFRVEKDDWYTSVSDDPSSLTIKYEADKPSDQSMAKP